MLTLLHLVPQDVLMFRTPRPFRGGERGDFSAESHLYPPPKTIAGAIASVLYSMLDQSKQNQVRTPEDVLREFHSRIIAYGWSHEGELLFPFPVGLIFHFGRIGGYTFAYVKNEKLSRIKDLENRLRNLLITEKGVRNILYGKDVTDDIIKALERRNSETVISLDEILTRELRTGIALGDNKITKEGYLYNATFIRPKKDTSIWIMADLKEDIANELKNKQVKLGGRGRIAVVKSVLRDVEMYGNPEIKPAKLSLITYAKYHRNGFYYSYPEWANQERSIITSLTYMSGWSLKSQRAEFLGYYVYPGSTYCVDDKSAHVLRDSIFYKVRDIPVARDCDCPLPINTYLVLPGGDVC
ncbi:MAG: hypothetical protein J7K58_04830 [Euryarchaeota archaeon]|nr:hypothetical protein [Euryarchaeota archaeon]